MPRDYHHRKTGDTEPDDIDYLDAEIRHHAVEVWCHAVEVQRLRSIKKKLLEAEALQSKFNAQLSEIKGLRGRIEDYKSLVDDMRLMIADLQQTIVDLRCEKAKLLSQNGQPRQQRRKCQRERSPGDRNGPRVQHNYFGSGSSAMIFNGEVNGKFTKDTQDTEDGTRQGRSEDGRNHEPL